MPNFANSYAPAVPPLPQVVHLPDLSIRALGHRFSVAFEACRRIACAVAGDNWAVSTMYESGLGISYVFRFACPMVSLRFSAQAAAAAHGCRTWSACQDIE